jgi:tRNA(fMet)-specific endonuclease VapC
MYLIDTDIIIYSLKGVAKVVNNLERHEATPKAISVITFGELVYGAMKSSRVEENMARVRRTAELFPVVDANRSIMDTFGSLKAHVEKIGKRTDDFDLIIAATALTLSYTLVTNNEKHFASVPGLSIENWSR